MIRALYTAASGMMAQQMNLDTIANNLANSSTTGLSSLSSFTGLTGLICWIGHRNPSTRPSTVLLLPSPTKSQRSILQNAAAIRLRTVARRDGTPRSRVVSGCAQCRGRKDQQQQPADHDSPLMQSFPICACLAHRVLTASCC